MRRKPRIRVMGATGKVGGAVIRALRGQQQVEVIAAARMAAKAARFGVPIVYLDLERIETIAPALQRVDGVFMVTGYTIDMLRQSKDVVNAARRAGVRQIVHLGACCDGRNLHAEPVRVRRRKLRRAGCDPSLGRQRAAELG